MHCASRRSLLLVLLSLFSCAAATPPAAGDAGLGAVLAGAAPDADPAVVELAARALGCARQAELATTARTLSVIDYSRPSTQRRLWVFDLDKRSLLFEELVAHGKNTGADRAVRFSNAPGSLMSSIGVFVTAEPYVGHNGYSLRLRGLDEGYNDSALQRDIVIHGAAYVDATTAATLGRLGRSFGCPAVRPAVARPLIDSIRDGSVLVAYYPDPQWLEHSRFVGRCEPAMSDRRAAPPGAVRQAP